MPTPDFEAIRHDARQAFFTELQSANLEERSALIDKFLITGNIDDVHLDENMANDENGYGSPENRVLLIKYICAENNVSPIQFQTPLFMVYEKLGSFQRANEELEHSKDLIDFYSTFRAACNILDNGVHVTEYSEVEAFIKEYRDSLRVYKNDTPEGVGVRNNPVGDHGENIGNDMAEKCKHVEKGRIAGGDVVSDDKILEKAYNEYIKLASKYPDCFTEDVKNISNLTQDDKYKYSIGIEDDKKPNFEARLRHDFASKKVGMSKIEGLQKERDAAKADKDRLASPMIIDKSIKNSIRQLIAPGIKKPLMAYIPILKGFTTYGKVSKAAEDIRNLIKSGPQGEIYNKLETAQKDYKDSIKPKSQLNGGGATPIGSSIVNSGAGGKEANFEETKDSGNTLQQSGPRNGM